MKIKTKMPEKKYPYLAVWTGGDPSFDINKVEPEDIVLIKLILKPTRGKGDDKPTPYVVSLFNNNESWFTSNESDYTPLPAGYKITVKQV